MANVRKDPANPATEQYSGAEKGDIVTRPDPSRLTTDQILRETAFGREIVGYIREIIEAHLEGSRAVIDMRIDGMDKAIILLQTNADLTPAQTKAVVDHLKELVFEKFSGVAQQFTERDERTRQIAEAVQKAIDAAFLAQKAMADTQQESNSAAIAKSELSTTENIKAIGAQVKAYADTTDGKFGDVKERITTLENRRDPMLDSVMTRLTALESGNRGARDNQNDNRNNTSDSRANISIVISIAAVVFLVLLHFVKV
jgi:hypothetical protein